MYRPIPGLNLTSVLAKSKCNILVNNPFESFNSYIIQARDKPIVWSGLEKD